MRIYTILLSIVLIQITLSAQSSTLDDFYKKAFGGMSNNSKSEIFLPLVINGKTHTEVFVLRKGQNIYIKENTVKYIIGLLKPKYKEAFPYKVDKSDFISTKQITKKGITIVFDETKIELKVTIPPKLKKAQEVNLHRNYNREKGNITPKEDYSGGATLYLNQSYSKEQNEFERLPLTGSSELFLNIHDVVIESEFRFNEELEDKIRRDNIKLTKDDKTNQLRYQVGDIYLPQLNRMTRSQSLGISVEKIFNMDEDYHQNISRINTFEFFLKNRSRIEIYVNNRFSRGFNLDAGTHNLYDLNIPTGLSHIKLKVIQESGKIEYIEFNDFDYSELYKEGVSRYGIGVGIGSQRDNNGKIIYDKEDKFASLYVEYGLNSVLTLKAGANLKKDYQSVMIEPIIGTPIGLFDTYAIGSHQKEDKIDGSKYGMNYRTNIGSINLSLGTEKIQKGFMPISNYSNTENSLESTLYRGSISTPFIYKSNLSLSASQYTKEEDKKEEYHIDFRKSFTQNLDVLVSYDYNKDITNSNNNQEVYVTLNYRYGNGNAQYSEYTEEQKHTLSLSHRTEGYYGLTSNLDLEDTPSNQRVTLRTNLRDEKFRLNSSYNYNTQKDSSISNQSLSTQFATGIYFAGDTFSISEPIDSSYIIVENGDKTKNNPLGIIGYHDIDDKPYSSFIVPNTDYRTKKMVVNELNLPMGMDVVDAEQYFLSSYKSGSVMKIEIKSFFSVQGRLIDQKGEPIALRAFKIFNPNTGTKEMAFTDEQGAFLLGNMEIGEYNAILFRQKGDSDVSKFSFSVKEEKGIKNLIEIGDIKVKLPKKKKFKKKAINSKK